MLYFTKTYRNDLPWLRMAIRSVIKCNTDAVKEWVVVTEADQVPHVEQIFQEENKGGIFTSRVVSVESTFPDAMRISDGYMRQQWIKMTAWRAIGDRVAFNWDSDVLACRKFSEKDLVSKDYRPVLWFSDMNQLIMGGYPVGRRDSLKAVFQRDCTFEFMRCMPIVLNGGILRHAEGQPEWSRSLDQCIAGNKAFSEFNVIGEFTHQYFPDAVHFKNAEKEGPTWGSGHEPLISQKWSWGGVTREVIDFVNNLPS